MPISHHSSFSSRQTGAGLIEVLVAVLVVTLGLLGAAGMHVRSVEFTFDTERRQMAAMVAAELLETMRSDTANILDETGMPGQNLGGYKKAAGTEMATVTTNDCQPLPQDASTRLGCWAMRAKKLMPELTDDLVTKQFVVSSDVNGVVSVRVAWPVKAGQCLNASPNENEYCTFTLQSRL